VVWSLAYSRLLSILPTAEAQREVEPQVAHRQHRGRGEVIPCYEFRAVRNAVLALLPSCKVSLASGQANVLARCLAPAGQALGLLFGSGELCLVYRPDTEAAPNVSSDGADSLLPEITRLHFESRTRLHISPSSATDIKDLCLWRSLGQCIWSVGHSEGPETRSNKGTGESTWGCPCLCLVFS
jgi:hypothetical protein